MPTPCHCPACLPSIPPDPATATPAALAAHATHLRRLAAIGSLPGPSPYDYRPATAPASTTPTW